MITAIAAVHTENFADGEAGVARAKAEIFEHQDPNGVAVVPADTPHYPVLAELAQRRGIKRVVTFAADDNLAAYARVTGTRVTWGQTQFDYVLGTASYQARLGLTGRHFATNAVACLALVQALGLDLMVAAESMAQITPVQGRGNVVAIMAAVGPVTMIDDRHNASPTSLSAALATLAEVERPAGGRLILCLGDMLELGPQTAGLHAGVADDVIAARPDIVLTCGPLMACAHQAIRARAPDLCAQHYGDAAAMAAAIAGHIRAHDTVFLKASRGSRLVLVVNALLGLDIENRYQPLVV
jgi:UDP-N-acetylmuramoyl-tripeptide--D-alanyl-D-alanine ligase